MKAQFFMKVPPGEAEAVEYVSIDPDDSGKNVIGRRATFAERERFPDEYQKFLDESEKDEEGTPVVADDPVPRLPPSQAAALGIGQDAQAIANQQNAGTPMKPQEKIDREAKAAESPEGALEVKQAAAESATPSTEDGEEGELDALTAMDAIAKVRDCTDDEKLELWLSEEQSREKPRTTVIDAIEARLGVLEEQDAP